MESKRNAAGFVAAVIARAKTDTAFKAAMSRADNPAQESYAWEYLIPYCNIENDVERKAFSLIGAAIARNKPDKDFECGFGDSLRSICSDEDDREREMRRLRRIVSCDSVLELFPYCVRS